MGRICHDVWDSLTMANTSAQPDWWHKNVRRHKCFGGEGIFTMSIQPAKANDDGSVMMSGPL